MLTTVDLFCGAGGFTEGFRQAGFHCVAANDADPWAGATFEANHGPHGTAFILGDISDPEIQERIADAARHYAVDVVIGGPPCQAFSQVRNHHRIIDDPRNGLYRHFVQMIAALRPRAFVMENVKGLDNLGGGRVREQIVEDLALKGDYHVRSGVVDAAHYGVPQNRPRILFVGIRSDLNKDPSLPPASRLGDLPRLVRSRAGSRSRYVFERSLLSETARQALIDPEDVRLVTVRQALSDLEHLRPSSKLARKPCDDPAPYESKALTAYQQARRQGSKTLLNADVPSIREDTVIRLEALPQGGNFRDLPDHLARRYLNGKKWGPEIGRDTLSRKYFFAYRKLHPDYFSWTLNTKADCVYHYDVPRALSVREFARLHSFDDSYHFMYGDRHSRYRQVGNAVPPLLAEAIAKSLRAVLLPARAEAPPARAALISA